jgi:prepilin-type N-terminal cleavage/methylation domain-containing protein
MGLCLRRSDSRDAGFTFIELVLVLAVASVILALTAGFYPQAKATIQGDSAMRVLKWQLKLARETAINERRAVQVEFLPPNRVRLLRHNLTDEVPTEIGGATLEHHMEFRLFQGHPDSPDTFGNSAALSFSGAASIRFTADGMLTDAAGQPINGTVFLGQAGRPMSARALTIFGPTSTIRTYRWNGSEWRR